MCSGNGQVMRLPVVFFLCVFLTPGIALAAECAFSSQQTRLSRVVAIDSTGGPIYEQAKSASSDQPAPSLLVLNDHEIVLTFDHGPHSAYTRYILDILDHHCVKATFFSSGRAALGNSNALHEIVRRGHTIAAGVWPNSHAADKTTPEEMKSSIEKALASVSQSAGTPAAPFIRLPKEQISPEIKAYLASRNISLWSFDLGSGDTEPGGSATRLANHTITRMQELGKGVIHFHETSKATVDALDSILRAAKQGSFKVVHIVPSTNFVALDGSSTQATAPAAAANRHLVESARKRVRSGDDGERRQRIARKRNQEEQSE